MASAGIGRSVEGVHAVEAAVAAGRVEHLWVEGRRTGALAGVIAAATARGASVEEVDDVRPRADSSAPQGVVARCRPLPDVGIDDLASVDRPAILVLDHLEDPHNVGAAARSALAAGMTGMVVSSDRAAPLTGTAFKAAVGALERLPVSVVHSVADAVARLAKLGVWTVGLDAAGGESLFGLGLLTEPVAIVVGAEGVGLGRLVAERCDVVASIPMSGPTESLNASVAAALGCFEVARVRRGVGPAAG
jgi:23S rRNA (guanosine2251-2'-O)-methyltransferase